MSMPTSIVSINDDTLMLIIDAILDLAPQRTNLYYGRLPNPVRNLLPLSLTCKHLRDQCLPIIFREAFSTRKGMQPRNIRKYVMILYLRDKMPDDFDSNDAGKTINLRKYIFNLSTFPALRRLVLEFSRRPSQMLLRAASAPPTLDDLVIECARLDGPRLSGFSRFTYLRRLTLSKHLSSEPPPQEELDNVRSYLHILSTQLDELEVSGDFCELRTLADTSWPRLRSLTMTGHVLVWDQTDLPSAVARMPCLRTFHMDFSVYYRSPWFPLPPFLYAPRTQREGLDSTRKSFLEALPHLTSLALSNVVYPYDAILDHLPERLVTLKVLARKDPFSYAAWDEGAATVIPRWYGHNPVSLSTAFHIVRQTSQMPALTELVLSLDRTPPSELVHEISKSCPHLTVLELVHREYGQMIFGDERGDAMADALLGLRKLQTLRISVAYVFPNGQMMLADSDNMAPFQHFVEMLAQRMMKLRFVWITCLRNLRWHIHMGSTIHWYRYVIYVDSRGRPYARGEFLLNGF
ncbi:hypothetical protein PLICRDRAFT_50993 [Plicaturopsis crispa FD-325 SS-3]|nr:hypothetical protein PLICRDRAFT_50993 [Plicaturopsis crispa FD-325 SS-3]